MFEKERAGLSGLDKTPHSPLYEIVWGNYIIKSRKTSPDIKNIEVMVTCKLKYLHEKKIDNVFTLQDFFIKLKPWQYVIRIYT